MNRDVDSFDPNSPNAMFATILARISSLHDDFQAFKKDSKDAEARIQILESERSYRKGSMAIIAIICSFFISVGTSIAAAWWSR